MDYSSFTAEQKAIEYIKCKNNILYFIFNYVKIPEIGGSLAYTPEHLHPKLRRVVRSAIRFDKVMFMASRQLGKALDISTPIPLPDGNWTTMGELKVGDIILGENGLSTIVTAATDIMHNHDCYKIEFDYAAPIIADADHLWKISQSVGKITDQIMTTLEVKRHLEMPKSKYGRPYIKINDAIENSEKDFLISPYLLGLWLGDGASKQANIATSDEDVFEIQSYVEECGYKVTEYKRKPNNPSGYFGVNGLITELKISNLFGNKHIPREYYSGSIDQRLELLRGLMDSDGYCDNKIGSCFFYQKNYNLILNVQELLYSLGIKNRVTSRIIKGDTYYTIKFTTADYIVFKLDRKVARQELCKDHPKNRRHFITKITKVDSVPVRCIQVDNHDKMFLCGSFIPTHNSTIAAVIIEYMMNFYPKNRAIIINMKKSAALENLNKIKFIHESLPDFLKPGADKKTLADRKTYLEYENGSRVDVFYPSTASGPDQIARSLTAPVLYIDNLMSI